jgi:hypothetical protein
MKLTWQCKPIRGLVNQSILWGRLLRVGESLNASVDMLGLICYLIKERSVSALGFTRFISLESTEQIV